MGVAPRVCSWHTSGHTIMSVNVFEPISESKLRTPHTQLARRNTRRARSVAPPVESWPKHTGSLPPVEFFQMETQRPVENCRQGRSMKSLRFARWSTHNAPFNAWQACVCVSSKKSTQPAIALKGAMQGERMCARDEA